MKRVLGFLLLIFFFLPLKGRAFLFKVQDKLSPEEYRAKINEITTVKCEHLKCVHLKLKICDREKIQSLHGGKLQRISRRF